MPDEEDNESLDKEVRRAVYDRFMASGKAPVISEVAQQLARNEDEVRGAFGRLAAGRVLVLQDGSGEVLMANPFSAVPTPFLVEVGGQTYYGNCIWDALGIPAMLDQDARITTGCGDCNDAMALEVRAGELEAEEGIVHFSVPAARWWDNIKFT
jgi:hypothetical protein